jgi:hypothetical protein
MSTAHKDSCKLGVVPYNSPFPVTYGIAMTEGGTFLSLELSVVMRHIAKRNGLHALRKETSMRIHPAILVLAVVMAVALALGGTPLAQEYQAQVQRPPTQQPSTPQPEFSQNQLKSFASAALQVQELRSKWQVKMQEAGSAEAASALQEQANTEIVQAVGNAGLTVESYNTIAAAARDNPDLANRIASLMKQK